MAKIYLSTWKLIKDVKKASPFFVPNVIVTGDDKDKLMNDDWYKRKTLQSIGIKKDYSEYIVKDVEITK